MPDKLIVTHIFPDLDAIASVWLLQRFDDDLKTAKLEFVPAGKTYQNQAVDSDPTLIHVDTGMGRFDHHQDNERTCAAKLVFNYLKSQKKISLKYQSALERLIEIVTQADQFEDFYWEKPSDDRYEFFLQYLLDNFKLSGKLNDTELVYQGMALLDAVLFGLRQKIESEKEIAKGIKFKSKWGRSLGVETQIIFDIKLAHKLGFNLVVRKETETGFVSIKSQPKKDLDLGEVYDELKKADSQADWFFHSSRHIISNGSRHNKNVKPSRLSLKEIIEIIKNINPPVGGKGGVLNDNVHHRQGAAR
ncbi:MAG: DHH family phosphoesterase [Candidatus Beckwithbacteria bacterium]|nr:DHH family phosphoesterase [Candidatus Beckwithbacteria bacterium]